MSQQSLPFILCLTIITFSSISAQSGNKTTTFNFVTLFDSSQNPDVSCYRIPAIAKAPNDDILVAVDERVPSCGDLKWSKDINIVLRRSTDDGSTWSDIQTIVNYPIGQSASDPSFIVDNVTNTIWLFYNYMDHDVGKDIYFLHTIYSTDNGHTWSTPKDITQDISKPEWYKNFKFITSGRGIQTEDGKLLHCLVNLESGTHIFGSDDHGNNWYLIDSPLHPANESKIVELSDGSWMVNSRVNGKPLRYVHHSTDQGKSWLSMPDTTLVDPNCNASIIKYPGENVDQNLLLFSNAASSDSRENLTLKISNDDGKNWDKGTQVYSGSAAYSTMSIIRDGNVGVVFEKDNYGLIVFAKLNNNLFQF